MVSSSLVDDDSRLQPSIDIFDLKTFFHPSEAIVPRLSSLCESNEFCGPAPDLKINNSESHLSVTVPGVDFRGIDHINDLPVKGVQVGKIESHGVQCGCALPDLQGKMSLSDDP